MRFGVPEIPDKGYLMSDSSFRVVGAMVYGGIEREELQLNEETFWAGSPNNNNNPNAIHVLPVVRKLIFEGRNKEAQRLIDAYFLTQQHGMSYLTSW